MKRHKENKKHKRNFLIVSLALLTLVAVVLSSNLISATYQRSFVGYTNNPTYISQIGQGTFPLYDEQMCKAGQDFILQIDPTGCTPSVVRSDLLEDQNVPVFCPVVATQINPLIDIQSIDHIQFSGQTPPGVAGIGYQPARAALGSFGRSADVTAPVFNNLGYAVIVLKQQKNETLIPDFIEGNLTATMRYNIKNAFGVGKASFYLPEVSDEKWQSNSARYSFWDGRGYLKAESVTNEGATISIYSGRENQVTSKSGDKVKLTSVTLKKGETSNGLIMPGFNYCFGTMSLRLNGLENPDTKVRLEVNGDTLELKDDEKFLNGDCTVRDVVKKGIVEGVKISCSVDEGSSSVNLQVVPKIVLSVDNEEKEVSPGDFLYDQKNSEGKFTGKKVYVGYVGTDDEGKLFIVPVVSTAQSTESFKSTLVYAGLPSALNTINFKAGNIGVDSVKWLGAGVYVGGASLFEWIRKGDSPAGILNENGEFTAWPTPSGLGTTILNGFKEIIGVDTTSYKDRIKIIGFAGPNDAELSDDLKKYYDNATKDYENVFQGFSKDKYPSDSEKTLGEEALQNYIDLSDYLKQKRKVLDLCETFNENYPSSNSSSVCDQKDKLSSSEDYIQDVVIGGRTYRIAFDKVVEPSLEDYSIEVSVTGAQNPELNGPKVVGLDGRIYLSDTEFIVLSDLERDYAVFDTRKVEPDRVAQTVSLTASEKIKDKETAVIGKNKYLVRVEEIKLKKVASVSVIPNVNYAGSNATFNFKIGVEKRNIKLSPEKTKEKIESVNKTLEKLKSVNDKIGSLVQADKTACLATQSYLTVKNFWLNLHGEGIARQKVMRGEDGWFKQCSDAANQGLYDESVDKCLSQNSDKIDRAVANYSKFISDWNNNMDNLENGIRTSNFLGEDVVDTEVLMQRIVTSTYKTDLKTKLQNAGVTDVKVANDNIPVSEIVDSMTSENLLLNQARDLKVNSDILASSADAGTKQIAQAEIESILGDVYVNTKDETAITDLSKELSDGGLVGIKVDAYVDKNSIKGAYDGYVTPKALGEIPQGASVKAIYYKNSPWMLQLQKVGDTYTVQEIYFKNGNKVNPDTEIYQEIKSRFIFEYADALTYQNPYKTTPELKYYESGNYKGLPAIVPFDIKNGWYAAVKSTLPIGGSIQSYDDSGRVSSFWLCNIGPDHEYDGIGIDDDNCQQMNLGTGQPYNVFNGLDPSEAAQKVNCAVNAIEKASKAYQAGVKRVSISTSCGSVTLEVGEPATNIPDIQCQDFMSPTDCNLLFNVCDPVVCPSSRCDLGGTYPVADVVQSGVTGSLALCLPNFGNPANGGVAVPICLSGLNAGLENYQTVLDSYQQCLQTSLETGQTVGICDEIYSVYGCELLWREVVPVAKYLIPQATGKVLGQSVRGGGEYLGAKDAFDKAGESVDYFTQYYAANSFKAFKARNAEEVGGAFCKKFSSFVVPEGGNLLDSLTTPDSPTQFYGRFDEIPYTTATNPPTSQYKVFYHIYAGKDYPANFQVYLKGDGSSYFQDTNFRRVVAQGFIAAGEYATDTPDFVAPSGYKEMCIIVNGQEVCGFKQVTTEFGLNYLTDKAVASQASQTDIQSESACVSGTANLYGLINPNVQAGVESAVNPALYNQGVTRICATGNPGQGTDAKTGGEGSRWQDVGYCGNEKIRCWLDTKSVENAIKSTSIEDSALQEVEGNYIEGLKKNNGYVEDFGKLVDDIKSTEDDKGKISKVTENIQKVFYNHEKGYLTLLRADAYNQIARKAYDLIASTNPCGNGKIDAGEGCDDGNTNDGDGCSSTCQVTVGGPETKPGEKTPGLDEIVIPPVLKEAIKNSDTSVLPYPIFRFNDGNLFGEDLYYTFVNEEWFWSEDKNRWISTGGQVQFYVSDLSEVEVQDYSIDVTLNSQSEEDKSFIKSLSGQSYLQGMNLLIRYTEKHEGSGIFVRKSKLSTGTTEFTPDDIFKVSAIPSINSVGYKLEYSAGARSWREVSDSNRESPEEVHNLLRILEGKLFLEGAEILFGIDSASSFIGELSSSGGSGESGGESGTGTSATETKTCDSCNGFFGKYISCSQNACENIQTADGRGCDWADGLGFWSNVCRPASDTSLWSLNSQKGVADVGQVFDRHYTGQITNVVGVDAFTISLGVEKKGFFDSAPTVNCHSTDNGEAFLRGTGTVVECKTFDASFFGRIAQKLKDKLTPEKIKEVEELLEKIEKKAKNVFSFIPFAKDDDLVVKLAKIDSTNKNIWISLAPNPKSGTIPFPVYDWQLCDHETGCGNTGTDVLRGRPVLKQVGPYNLSVTLTGVSGNTAKLMIYEQEGESWNQLDCGIFTNEFRLDVKETKTCSNKFSIDLLTLNDNQNVKSAVIRLRLPTNEDVVDWKINGQSQGTTNMDPYNVALEKINAPDFTFLIQHGRSTVDCKLLGSALTLSEGEASTCRDDETGQDVLIKLKRIDYLNKDINLIAGDEAVLSTQAENQNKCSECGSGLFNKCDEQECIGLGSNCVFNIDGLNSCFDKTTVPANESSGTTGTGSTSQLSLSCTTGSECQKVIGQQIARLAIDFKNANGISDAQVQADTGAKSFECLALLVAYQESRIKQCSSLQQSSNPLYCESDPNSILKGDQGNANGIFQINQIAHPDSIPAVYSFDGNVNYGLGTLFGGYNASSKIYSCYRPLVLGNVVREGDFQTKSYSGWQRALRSYNGWNSQCLVKDSDGNLKKDSDGNYILVGNPYYVEEVIGSGHKAAVASLFPECV